MAIPAAPVLSANGQLGVFVHHSYTASMHERLTNQRLRTLGNSMLLLAYSEAVRAKYPALGTHQLQQYVGANYLRFVAHWVNVYGWTARMRAVPREVNINNPQEMQLIFEAYAGALVAEQEPGSSPTVLFDWIKRLVNSSS